MKIDKELFLPCYHNEIDNYNVTIDAYLKAYDAKNIFACLNQFNRAIDQFSAFSTSSELYWHTKKEAADALDVASKALKAKFENHQIKINHKRHVIFSDNHHYDEYIKYMAENTASKKNYPITHSTIVGRVEEPRYKILANLQREKELLQIRKKLLLQKKQLLDDIQCDLVHSERNAL